MTDINELVTIIRSLEGRAQLSEIAQGYGKLHHMVMLSEHRAVIVDTLKKNPSLVRYDSNSQLWELIEGSADSGKESTATSNDNHTEGSPDWFREKAKEPNEIEFLARLTRLRSAFDAKYNPKLLDSMTGEELLKQVFGNDGSMINLLTLDDDYRSFGAAGRYKYLRLVYQKADGDWAFYNIKGAEALTEKQAEEKAKYVISLLLQGAAEIEKVSVYDSIADYEALEMRLNSIEYTSYAWVLKYYQMIFGNVLPGMYADKTINRAISILGLEKHGNHRISNMGEIALFTRECGINNIVFSDIYGNHWGWDEERQPSEYAKLKGLH